MTEQLQLDFDKVVKTSTISKKDIELKRNYLKKFLDISQIIKKNIGDLSFFNDYSLPNKIDPSIFVNGLEHNKIIFINGRIEKIDFTYEDQKKLK